MKTINLVQGSNEWHQFRANHFTASDAPAMLGLSKYKTRDQLLQEKVTGITPDVTEQQQIIFDKGHRAEELARPITEEIIGDELYPATATSDEWEMIAASFDGITMFEDQAWEHKLHNQKLIDYIELNNDLPDTHWPQLEQQLYVSGAEYIIFTVSDGTKENRFETKYVSNPARRTQLLNGWKQFQKDMENYQVTEKKPEPVGKDINKLPALMVEIEGSVKGSNLDVYRNGALAFVNSISTDLQTDQDFADAEKAVKFCKDAEKKIKSVKEQAMSNAADINAVFTGLDEISEALRQKRLELDKLVKAQKEQRKHDVITNAMQEITGFVKNLESNLNGFRLNDVEQCRAVFIGAMKGKKTLSSIESCVNDAVATAKIDYQSQFETVDVNVRLLEDNIEYKFLFNDAFQFINKAPEDFEAFVKVRIAEHQKAEEERLAKERAQIREEEERKAREEAEKAAQAQADESAQDRSAKLKSQVEESFNRVFDDLEYQPVQLDNEVLAPECQVPPAEVEMVSIPRHEYEELLDSQLMLECLESAGVDNWSGYSCAMEEYENLSEQN